MRILRKLRTFEYWGDKVEMMAGPSGEGAEEANVAQYNRKHAEVSGEPFSFQSCENAFIDAPYENEQAALLTARENISRDRDITYCYAPQRSPIKLLPVKAIFCGYSTKIPNVHQHPKCETRKRNGYERTRSPQ